MVTATDDCAVSNRAHRSKQRSSIVIDIWVVGGRESVAAICRHLGVAVSISSKEAGKSDKPRQHLRRQACEGADAQGSTPRYEVLLRRAAGDQAGDVVEFLCVLVDKAEGQLQPIAVGFGFVGDDGV